MFLPSLTPRWQAGMTRSKLAVVGVCHMMVEPFSSKPRVGSGLPEPAFWIGDPPATRGGFDPF